MIDSYVNDQIDFSKFRLFIRFTSLAFFISSIFVNEWFCLAKNNESILVKIGILKYCNEGNCYSYKLNHCNYI